MTPDEPLIDTRNLATKTLRDEFAMHAMQALVSNYGEGLVIEIRDGLRGAAGTSKVAYVIADAMLAERAK